MLYRNMTVREGRRRADQGDTLIEVMIAVAILAIAGVALIGSVLTSITASSEHRFLTLNDVYIKSYSDAAIQQIERASSPLFSDCASTYSLVKPSDIPSNYPIVISSIEYWTGSAWGTSCTPGSDQAQLITVQVQSPTQIVTTLSFAVRDPATVIGGA